MPRLNVKVTHYQAKGLGARDGRGRARPRS